MNIEKSVQSVKYKMIAKILGRLNKISGCHLNRDKIPSYHKTERIAYFKSEAICFPNQNSFMCMYNFTAQV